jgi:hypothetical protein
MSLNLKPGTQRGLRFIGKLQKLNLTQRFLSAFRLMSMGRKLSQDQKHAPVNKIG